jgi:ACT domain-containing protein
MIKVIGIKNRIEEKGISKTWLIKKLGISRGTFYSRLKDGLFTTEEYSILKIHGLV